MKTKWRLPLTALVLAITNRAENLCYQFEQGQKLLPQSRKIVCLVKCAFGASGISHNCGTAAISRTLCVHINVAINNNPVVALPQVYQGENMNYNGEGVHALVCAVEDLTNSNLIFVDRKLKPVLKCLAYYPEFRSVLSKCSQGFDYDAEKKKACSKLGDSDVFRLPKNPKTLVSLVSNMLVEFDADGMDVVAFSAKYFPEETKQASFEQFCSRIVEPFKLALVSLVVDGVEDEVQTVERTVEFASSGLHQQTEYLIVAMYNTLQEATLDDGERADFMIMLEGFAAALDTRDSLMIKAVWTGLKKALLAKKLCQKEVEKTSDVLRLYLVTK